MTSLADRLRHLLQGRTGLAFSEPRWIVLARVEDERSDFAPSRRITHSMLDGLVATFDVQRRQVPIICSQGADIPAHWADPLPPVGDVVALARDHINLWGAVRSIIDPALDLPRLDLCVSSGFNQRSVAFRTQSNETDGQPVLYHLALLGGEPPGISNMPTLAEHGLGLDDTQLAALRSRSTEPGSVSTFLLSGAPVEKEWAVYGGLAHYRTLADQLEYGLPAASPDTPLTEASPVADETRDSTSTESAVLQQLAALTEGLQALSARLPSPVDESGDPDPTRSRGAPPAPPATPETPVQLQQRAAVAAHRASGFGMLPAAAAREQARSAVEGGVTAVDAFERLVDSMARAQSGQLFQEVRTATGPVEVNVASHQFRVISNPDVAVNEEKLALLAQVLERVQPDGDSDATLDLKRLERVAQRYWRARR